MKQNKSAPMLAAIFSLLLSPTAQAGREGNGGHPVALEFIKSAEEAIRHVEENISRFPRAKAAPLRALLDNAKIFAVDEPLLSKSKDGVIVQESAIVNLREPDIILVHGARWGAIARADIRRAIALHEVLSLAGIEETGVYAVSKAYLLERGIECEGGITENCKSIPQPPGGKFNHAAGMALFAQAVAANPENLSGEWNVVAMSTKPGIPYRHEDRQNSDGIKNDDGTTPSFSFGSRTSFDGTTTDQVVTFNNFGSKSASQGPFKVHASAEGSICFSTWSWNNGSIDKDAHYNYACRAMPNDENKLICAATYMQTKPNKKSKDAKYHGKVLHYLGFTRK